MIVQPTLLVKRFFSRLGIAALLCTATLTACENREPPPQKPVRPVKSLLVGEYANADSRRYPGRVEAAEQVDLAFQVPGQLIELPVRNGQEVKRGELLARLDPRDYASNLKAAKAEFQRAEAEFRRAGELVEKQLISRSEYDSAKARRDVAEADVERAQKALNDTRLLAPFAGVISHKYVENFQDVSAKQAIVSLQDTSSYEVIIQVPEYSVLRVGHNRDRVQLVASFDALPQREFPLQIKEFETEANPTTQTFEVVLQMPRPEGEITILPGMSVTVTAKMPTGAVAVEGEKVLSGQVLIPATALFSDRTGENAQYVWIIDPGTAVVSRRQVQVGRLLGNSVEVLSGLASGERIVVAGVHYLHEGDKVRLLKGKIGA